MSNRKNRKSWTAVLLGAGSVVAMGLGAALLHYLRSGVGESEARFIPKAVDARLDKVVDALNRKFGKRWVNRGISTLQTGLAAVLPAPLVALIEVVHRVEHLAEQKGWNSKEKLAHAVEMT